MSSSVAGNLDLFGSTDLLKRTRRAILVSRTERRPTPSTGWVRAIVDAVGESVQKGEVVVTGVGRTPFDVALAACRVRNGSAIVVLEASSERKHWIEYARGMIPDDTLYVSPSVTNSLGGADSLKGVPVRDQLLGVMAESAWRINVRGHGNMSAVAEWMIETGREVRDQFAVRIQTAKPSIALPALKVAADAYGEDWTYLTHYTREPDGAWPHESPAEYASWLAFGSLDDRRGPAEALSRILEARTILGSGRLMPGRRPMVSFTERPPWEMAALTKWRPGLRRWSFRPYGLAIRRDLLEGLGARPVSYLPELELKALSCEQRVYAQKHEPPATDWSGEAEWRLPGDLELECVPAEAMLALVTSAKEATHFQKSFGLRTRVICE